MTNWASNQSLIDENKRLRERLKDFEDFESAARIIVQNVAGYPGPGTPAAKLLDLITSKIKKDREEIAALRNKVTLHYDQQVEVRSVLLGRNAGMFGSGSTLSTKEIAEKVCKELEAARVLAAGVKRQEPSVTAFLKKMFGTEDIHEAERKIAARLFRARLFTRADQFSTTEGEVLSSINDLVNLVSTLRADTELQAEKIENTIAVFENALAALQGEG